MDSSLYRVRKKILGSGKKRKEVYLSPVWGRGFVRTIRLFFCFIVFPSFSVTTHSLTLFASRSPMIAALVRWSDMTFSNKIQNTTRCRDLPHSKSLSMNYNIRRDNVKGKWKETLVCLSLDFLLLPWGADCI